MPDPAQPTPRSAAQAAKLAMAEGVETLHEALRTYGNKTAKDYYTLFASRLQYQGTIARLDEDSFIPHSARF